MPLEDDNTFTLVPIHLSTADYVIQLAPFSFSMSFKGIFRTCLQVILLPEIHVAGIVEPLGRPLLYRWALVISSFSPC